jgi:thioester reductase-like protein
MPAERQRLVLCRLRSDGWHVPLLLRPPADDLATLPPLEPECFLAPDIAPVPGAVVSRSPPTNIFLTGATGFVGGFLLDELLRRTSATLYCLVRSEDAPTGKERVLRNLRALTGHEPPGVDRIRAVSGDLSRRRFGLSEAAFDTLATEADLVIHSGALVNFLYGYDAFLGPNIVGTQEVLRFACSGHLKPVHFISSLAMFMIALHPKERTLVPEGVSLEYGRGAVGGYGQSKWVCESMLELARQRGVPIVVHRPGLVLGHSQTGVANAQDLLFRTMQSIAQLGLAPDSAATIEAIPVDALCRTVVSLALRPDTVGNVFHYRAEEACPVMPVEVLRDGGYLPRVVGTEAWLSYIRQTPDNALHALLPLFTARWAGERSIGEILTVRPRVDAHHTHAVLSLLGETLPSAKEVMSRTLEWMRRTGVVPPPPLRTRGDDFHAGGRTSATSS